MLKPVVLLSTCNDAEKARQIAYELVDQRLAACVNVIPGVQSTYRWEGKVQVDSEFLLIIKSQSEQVHVIKEAIKELSGYQLPELIAMEIVDGSETYLDWLISESRQVAVEPSSE